MAVSIQRTKLEISEMDVGWLIVKALAMRWWSVLNIKVELNLTAVDWIPSELSITTPIYQPPRFKF